MSSPASSRVPLSERLRAPEVAEVPGPHHGLTWRHLGAGDSDAILDLVARCAVVDKPLAAPGPLQVADAFDPAHTQVRDSLGGFSSDGELQAMAVVYLPPGDTDILRAFITATIAPGWRGRGIGRALLDWQDARARQLLAQDGRDLPARIGAYVDEHLTDRRRLYVAAGFSPKRVFQEMRRPVSAPVPDAPLAAGLRMVDWTPDLDDEIRHTHNEAFADHWGSQPLTTGSWRRVLRELEPRWSKIALARTADGAEEVAGYALTSRHEHAWAALGFSEGYTEFVGVRRGYRGRGVARSLLAGVIRALAADGIESAGLDVDTINPSGAHGFYERLGYQRQGAQILYTIEI